MSEQKKSEYIWKKTPQFLGNIILRGKIETMTGLHIGGNQEKFAIGGVTATVLRDQATRFPFIPGSSLKGKVRSRLEYELGVVGVGAKGVKELGLPSHDTRVVRLFGIGAEQEVFEPGSKTPVQSYFNVGSTLFRDCYPDEATVNRWKMLDTETLYTEVKSENSVDRITSEANPRFPERVVKGSFFNMEIVFTVFDRYRDQAELQADLDNLLAGLRLLEDSALGGSGSRGYGEIRFHMLDPIYLLRQDYRKNSSNYQESVAPIPENSEKMKLLSDQAYVLDAGRIFAGNENAKEV